MGIFSCLLRRIIGFTMGQIPTFVRKCIYYYYYYYYYYCFVCVLLNSCHFMHQAIFI
jgi:hypothetical protein